MKKLFGLMLSLMLIVVGCYLIYDSGIRPLIENKQTVEPYDNLTKELLSPGEVFKQGSFIEVDGVEILYDGQYFLVTNNRTDLVRISCSVVGVKKDGTYDTIQLASFVGVDKTQYERDKSENGWAIKKDTNLIRPNETLNAVFEAFDFNKADSDYPKNDIDEDGYLDILFTISPQKDETSVTVSSNDIKSKIYKIENNR